MNRAILTSPVLSPLTFAAVLALAQMPPQSALEQAIQSPSALIKYVNRNQTVDWEAFWPILRLEKPAGISGLCNSANPCTAQLIQTPDPNRAIVFIGGVAPRDDLYLRYQRKAEGLWKITGRRFTFVKEYPRHHEQAMIGGRPYLKLWTDQSQVGFALIVKQEQWFDLTNPDFTPAFSYIAEGSYSNFSFAIHRAVTSVPEYIQLPGGEQIDLTVSVSFGGPFESPPSCATTFHARYSRPTGARGFTLHSAEAGGVEMPPSDFLRLGGSSLDLANHRVLRYALPCLKAIAAGDNQPAKDWLRQVLANTRDCDEKRALGAF